MSEFFVDVLGGQINLLTYKPMLKKNKRFLYCDKAINSPIKYLSSRTNGQFYALSIDSYSKRPSRVKSRTLLSKTLILINLIYKLQYKSEDMYYLFPSLRIVEKTNIPEDIILRKKNLKNVCNFVPIWLYPFFMYIYSQEVCKFSSNSWKFMSDFVLEKFLQKILEMNISNTVSEQKHQISKNIEILDTFLGKCSCTNLNEKIKNLYKPKKKNDRFQV